MNERGLGNQSEKNVNQLSGFINACAEICEYLGTSTTKYLFLLRGLANVRR